MTTKTCFRLAAILATGLIATQALAADKDARLIWADQVAMSPLVSGVVERIAVTAGEVVEQGQPLVLLDDREFRARLMRAQARVNAAKASHDEASSDAERGDELYDRGALSGVAADQRHLVAANSKADFLQAVAERDLAKLDLERSQLRAPFAARVLSVEAAPGQVVITRFEPRALLTLVADGRMRARTLVDVDQLSRLEPGMEVAVKTAGREYPGRIVVLGVEPEGSSNYRVEAEFGFDPGQGLRAGQPVTLVLP